LTGFETARSRSRHLGFAEFVAFADVDRARVPPAPGGLSIV
jgi:hypothetical protein